MEVRKENQPVRVFNRGGGENTARCILYKFTTRQDRWPSELIGRKLHLDLCNGLRRVETFGAGAGAVEDSVTAVHAHRVLEFLLPVGAVCIPRIGDPSVCLHQSGRPKILILIPPVRRTRGRATGAKNTLVHPVEFLTVLLRLYVFTLFWGVIVL